MNVSLVRSSLIFRGKISGLNVPLMEEDSVKLRLLQETPGKMFRQLSVLV